MIITEPNEFVAEVHDRMPLLLTEKQFDPWLRADLRHYQKVRRSNGPLSLRA
jgi:putative SOS response-associated peptidase YedK